MKKNVSHMSGVAIGTKDDEKPNSLLGLSARSGRKVEASNKSLIYTNLRVPINLSAEKESKLNEKRIIVCALKADNTKLDTVHVVSSHLSNNMINDFCDVGGGTVLSLSSDELQERVVANMAEKQHDVQASNSKQGHKSKNSKTKGITRLRGAGL